MTPITSSPRKGKSANFSIELIGTLMVLMIFFMINSGCNKNNLVPGSTEHITGNASDLKLSMDYEEANLVSDSLGFNATHINANVNNAWGIAFAPNTGNIWVASNHKGMAVALDRMGNQIGNPVNIPLNGVPNGSSPDGIVVNNTSDFVIPSTGATSKIIIATEDGIISAWSSGDSAIKVADRSGTGAVYKGLAMASSGGNNYVYATNFNAGTVDVFDKSFNYVSTFSFTDGSIPSGFAPFNIKAIDGKLYVTYAKQKAGKHDDQAGPGNGYVDIYNNDGSFVSRFASTGTLNSPWGLADSEDPTQSNERILVGNFGDGRINVFDLTGTYMGQLMDGADTITIKGLWAISFPPNASNQSQLFFTAGPDEENHGVFGFLNKK